MFLLIMMPISLLDMSHTCSENETTFSTGLSRAFIAYKVKSSTINIIQLSPMNNKFSKMIIQSH